MEEKISAFGSAYSREERLRRCARQEREGRPVGQKIMTALRIARNVVCVLMIILVMVITAASLVMAFLGWVITGGQDGGPLYLLIAMPGVGVITVFACMADDYIAERNLARLKARIWGNE